MTRLFLLYVMATLVAGPVVGCTTTKNVAGWQTVAIQDMSPAKPEPATPGTPPAAKPAFPEGTVQIGDTFYAPAPAGGTNEERTSTWVDNWPLWVGVGAGVFLGGMAALYCAESGNCVPEGGHFDASGAHAGR